MCEEQDLQKASGIGATCIAKIGRGENVSTDVLVRICTALDCRLEDIMELVPDEAEKSGLIRRKVRHGKICTRYESAHP